MAREVDIKALISHIITGDGLDRCRICMGDTSDGQVFLEDAILIEDNKPVSLGDLLKTITGVEVKQEWGLPRGVCKSCYESATAAFSFNKMVLHSHKQWDNIDNLLYIEDVEDPDATHEVFYIFYNEKCILKDVDLSIYEVNTLDDCNEIKSQEVTKDRLFPCPDCGKMFKMNEKFNLHLHRTKNRICKICGAIVRREKLQTHLLKKHQINLIKCVTCFKLFDSEVLHNQHVIANHGENSETCKVCGEGFVAGTKSLQSHMYSHSVFYCDGCGKSFENRRCAQHHKRICAVSKKITPQSPYQCNDCGQVYVRKGSLRAHIIQKHSNVLPFQCNYCDKKTSTVSHLHEHEQIHKVDRIIFKCDECPAMFKSKLGYKLHKKSHKGEKNYVCAQCGESFVSASRRSDHVKRQHRAMEDLDHGCPYCPAKFIRPFALRKHIRDSHGVFDCEENAFTFILSDQVDIEENFINFT